MKRWGWSLVVAGAVISCGKRNPEVTVFAASSLHEVVSAMTQEWSRKTGQSVRLRFDASSTLARQIREGAPADLFLSADPRWVDTADRLDWIGNRLACVVSVERGSFDWASVKSLALAGDQVPAGAYARTALHNLGLSLPPRLLYGTSVRDVLSKVSSGAAEVGIVYATDAAVDPHVRIAFLLPEESHPRIIYVAARLTVRADPLYAALREEWVLAIAERRGFRVLR